jgi:peptide/nickel transport system substrate-binding protein
MAIDVEDVLKRVYLGINAIPEPGTYMHHFEANRWAYNPDAKQPTYDPTQAEKLLDEAGYPRGSDGVRFRVRNVVPTVMSFPEAMDIVRTQVAKVGIEMSLEVVEWATYTDKALTRRDHDLTVSAGYQGPDPLEFFSYVGTVKGTPNFRNAMGYYNPEVDQLFTEYAQTVDREARRKAFFRIQEILAEDLPRFNLGAWLGSYARKASLLGSYTDPADFKTSRHWDFGAFYHKDWT